jgi:hypothetical protein
MLLAASAAPARIEDFEAILAASPTATVALETWCQSRFGVTERVRATKVLASSNEPTARIRGALELGRDERLAYRRVRLSCAGRELSLAYNWYVPARLTPEMIRQLAETDIPFGRIAEPLGFKREPIAKPWSGPELCPAGTVLSNRALLRLPDGKPLAMVVECYTKDVLGE